MVSMPKTQNLLTLLGMAKRGNQLPPPGTIILKLEIALEN